MISKTINKIEAWRVLRLVKEYRYTSLFEFISGLSEVTS
jgi:hypothetical protein